MSMIKLKDILPISKEEQKKYKINFHTLNRQQKQPLDVFVENREYFHGWNRGGEGKSCTLIETTLLR